MDKKLLISKIKITKEHTANIEYSVIDENNSLFSDNTSNFKNMVHKDFKDAMTLLVPHMILITEMTDKDLNKLTKKDQLPFEVKGLSISGDDVLGCVISGRKNLMNGKVFNINTPFTNYEPGAGDDYAYLEELDEVIGIVLKEAQEYINGKKDDSQGDLFKEEGEKEPESKMELAEA